MMAGVLISSITSGNLISRTGRYRPFPIIGTAVAASAMILLSRLAISTPIWLAALYMLVLGLGLGMVMQVLVLAAQNAVPYKLLGVATSGSTLFRQIGGAIGVSIFGAIFANRLATELAERIPRRRPHPGRGEPCDRASPARGDPAAVHRSGHGGADADLPRRRRIRDRSLSCSRGYCERCRSARPHRRKGSARASPRRAKTAQTESSNGSSARSRADECEPTSTDGSSRSPRRTHTGRGVAARTSRHRGTLEQTPTRATAPRRSRSSPPTCSIAAT